MDNANTQDSDREQKEKHGASPSLAPAGGWAASWKSMKDFDRSEMQFVLLYEDGAMRLYLWNPRGFFEHTNPIGAQVTERDDCSNPTHWSPLPEPPIAADERPAPERKLNMADENTQPEGAVEPASTTGYLKEADLEASPAEIIQKLAGLKLPLTNGWGMGVVVGAWKIEGKRVKLLLAWPNATNPNQLFNEDAASFLPPSDNGPNSPTPGQQSAY